MTGTFHKMIKFLKELYRSVFPTLGVEYLKPLAEWEQVEPTQSGGKWKKYI